MAGGLSGRNRIFLLALALWALLAPRDLWAAGRQQLQGQVPSFLSRFHRLGPLGDGEPVTLSIGLPFRNQPELQAFVQAAQDPHSPQYRHFLTAAQFTDRFGPTPGDYQALIAFAQSHHLRVLSQSPGRAILEVEGSA